MSSRDEVQKMINIRNEVDSRFNEMVNLMEANVELELQQHQLFKKVEDKLNKMVANMMDLDKKQKQPFKEQEAKLAAKEELLREEMKQQVQQEFEEYKQKSKENYQQQLKKQEEELKVLQIQMNEVREMLSTLQSGSIKSHNHLLSRVDQSVTTTAASKLVRSGRETEGTYENWDFGDGIPMIPLSEVKKMVTELEDIDVTVFTQKVEAMTLINRLEETPQMITVTKNRRFPINGDYVMRVNINELYDAVQRIDNSKSSIFSLNKYLIFKTYAEIGSNKGWKEAHKHAMINYSKCSSMPQLNLSEYLWLLCLFVNIEKDNSLRDFKVYNVTIFEKDHRLTWKE